MKIRLGKTAVLEASVQDEANRKEKVRFRIYKKVNGKKEKTPYTTIYDNEKDGKAKVDWKYIYIHDYKNPISEKPKFCFDVWSFRTMKVTDGSEDIEISMDIKIQFINNDGKPVKNKKCKLKFSNGKVEDVVSDSEGYIKKEDMVPNNFIVEFKNRVIYDKESKELSNSINVDANESLTKIITVIDTMRIRIFPRSKDNIFGNDGKIKEILTEFKKKEDLKEIEYHYYLDLCKKKSYDTVTEDYFCEKNSPFLLNIMNQKMRKIIGRNMKD